MKKIIRTSAFISSLLFSVAAKAQLASSQPSSPEVSKQTAPKTTAASAETQTASATKPVYAKPAVKPSSGQAAASEQMKMREPAPRPAYKTAVLKPVEQKEGN